MSKAALGAALVLAAAAACAPDRLTVVRRSAPHMGTVVTISIAARSEAAGERVIEQGFAEVARLEQLLSSYRPDSDLSRLNAQAGAGPVTVAPELLEATQRAVDVAAATGGAFNPLITPAVRLWGIPERPRVPAAEELGRLRPLVDLAGLTVRSGQGTITLSRPGMTLGLGGIGKGYAADGVADLLRARGVAGGIVELSGDVRVFGPGPAGRPWRIAVRDPHGGSEPLAVLELTEGAVSTSGTYERFFDVDGARYHHILDPRTLRPTRGLTSVTILAEDATAADGLATGVLVMGVEEGMALVERTSGVEALLMDARRQVHASQGWPATP